MWFSVWIVQFSQRISNSYWILTEGQFILMSPPVIIYDSYWFAVRIIVIHTGGAKASSPFASDTITISSYFQLSSPYRKDTFYIFQHIYVMYSPFLSGAVDSFCIVLSSSLVGVMLLWNNQMQHYIKIQYVYMTKNMCIVSTWGRSTLHASSGRYQ